MKKSLLAVTVALAFSAHAQLAFAQASTATGGAGGAGGSASGGTATGGAATNSSTNANSNNISTSGGGGGTGGQGGLGGQGGVSSAQGGTASATGVQTGAINSTGNNQAAEVTVNYIQPSSPGGLKGLAAGVDPETGHFVNDNNVHYSGTQKIKNTPDASIGGPASGPCNGFSGGIGISVPGFGFGANTSTVDPGCTARETARIAAMLGRMDIANAVLENTDVVQAALKARAARAAAAEAEAVAATPASAPASVTPAVAPRPTQSPGDRAIEEARLREQQRLAVETLQRKSTMDKVYDTMTFTDAVSQSSERTPQQVMAEESIKKQEERTRRAEEQVRLERRLAALKSEPVANPNAMAPQVPDMSLALTAKAKQQAQQPQQQAQQPQQQPQAQQQQPQQQAQQQQPQQQAQQQQPQQQAQQQQPQQQAQQQQAQQPQPQQQAQQQQQQQPQQRQAQPAAPAKAPVLDSVETARMLLNVDPSSAKPAAPVAEKVATDAKDRAPAAAPAAPPAAPAQAKPAQPQVASQPMIKNVKLEKLNDMFGFPNKSDDESEARKPAPKPTDAAKAPVQQAAAKPADDPKAKPAAAPVDPVNVARVLNIQPQ